MAMTAMILPFLGFASSPLLLGVITSTEVVDAITKVASFHCFSSAIALCMVVLKYFYCVLSYYY